MALNYPDRPGILGGLYGRRSVDPGGYQPDPQDDGVYPEVSPVIQERPTVPRYWHAQRFTLAQNAQFTVREERIPERWYIVIRRAASADYPLIDIYQND